MSADDEPTTAAEMELLHVVETVVDEAEETQLQEDLIMMALWWEEIRHRAERGELTETERRTLLAHLNDMLPQADLLVEQARRRSRGDQ